MLFDADLGYLLCCLDLQKRFYKANTEMVEVAIAPIVLALSCLVGRSMPSLFGCFTNSCAILTYVKYVRSLGE